MDQVCSSPTGLLAIGLLPMRVIPQGLAARPALCIAVVIGLLAVALLPWTMQALTHGVLAWDLGCIAYLAAVTVVFTRERDIARDAVAQEEGEWTIFFLIVGATIASFAAILGVFTASKTLPPAERDLHIGLVALTLLVSWLVTHTVFALRYAHEYYARSVAGQAKVDGGLDFPGDQPPDYWDFFYFALVLGMTFQVSDVQISSRKLRRLATLHGLLGFLFNTVILALSVNIGASLL